MCNANGCRKANRKSQKIRAQLFKTNDVNKRIVKTLIIKYGKYSDIFAEKMWVAKATHIFQQKCLWIRYYTY